MRHRAPRVHLQWPGRPSSTEVGGTTLHAIDTDRPAVSVVDADGTPRRTEGGLIGGCDGLSRFVIPALQTWERAYRFAWLGVLAQAAPSTDERIYAWHPAGLALHSMPSHEVSCFYLQVAPDEDIAGWSDDRIWDALATRLRHGQDGWQLTPGPISEKSAADAQPCRHADAPRPARPHRRRRPHRRCSSATTRWPPPTPSGRCVGSGAAPTSAGG